MEHARRVAQLCMVWLMLLPLAPGWSADVQYDRYHSYDELTVALKQLVVEHKDIAELTSIGKTVEGRDIWAVRISSEKTGDPDKKQALLIVGNLEGHHIVGSEMALRAVDYLLSHYDSDDTVRNLIDTRAFYMVPRVNPDGAEAMFGTFKWEHCFNATPWDDDFDDTADEDGPEDLNGDGLITMMRVPDPTGDYMIDPKEPRLMKKADRAKGEKGGYKVYSEGLDNDGDEECNEDGPGGVDIDMNFPHAYAEHKLGAGRYAISEPESRALIDFVLVHRNIAAILTYSVFDNLLTPPKPKPSPGGQKEMDISQFMTPGGRFEIPPDIDRETLRRMFERKAATSVAEEDIPYYERVSERYKKIVGMEEDKSKDKPEPTGAFYEWSYFQYGVPSFSAKVWTLPKMEEKKPEMKEGEAPEDSAKKAEAPEEEKQDRRPPMRGRMKGMRPGGKDKDEAGDDTTWLKWIDQEMGGKGFVPWTKFQHPTLGEVEIGGFEPFVKTNPPAEKLDSLGEKYAKFAVYLAGLFPQIAIAKTEVTSHGGGVFGLKAEIENSGYLPTVLNHGVKSQAVKPTLVKLQLDGAELLTGNKLKRLQTLEGSGKRQEYEWLLKAKPGTTVLLEVVSEKAGRASKKITLQ